MVGRQRGDSRHRGGAIGIDAGRQIGGGVHARPQAGNPEPRRQRRQDRDVIVGGRHHGARAHLGPHHQRRHAKPDLAEVGIGVGDRRWRHVIVVAAVLVEHDDQQRPRPVDAGRQRPVDAAQERLGQAEIEGRMAVVDVEIGIDDRKAGGAPAGGVGEEVIDRLRRDGVVARRSCWPGR